MRHETAQLHLAGDAGSETFERKLHEYAASLAGLRHIHAARNLEGCWGAGHYTVDLQFDAGAPFSTDLTQLPGVTRADHAIYRRLAGGKRAPGLRNGIWRTLLFSVRPDARAEHVAALERDLLRMPHYMPGIRNWQLGRIVSDSAWTHVWQQEFECVEDLQGEYLMHPFHWGRVDRWFDPEFPEWIVTAISHAFCPLTSSILVNTADKESP
jgi:hypothetical protein